MDLETYLVIDKYIKGIFVATMILFLPCFYVVVSNVLAKKRLILNKENLILLAFHILPLFTAEFMHHIHDRVRYIPIEKLESMIKNENVDLFINGSIIQDKKLLRDITPPYTRHYSKTWLSQIPTGIKRKQLEMMVIGKNDTVLLKFVENQLMKSGHEFFVYLPERPKYGNSIAGKIYSFEVYKYCSQD